MSETDRAICRAQGALDNFLDQMREEMIRCGRSDEYKERFWDALKNAAFDKLGRTQCNG